MTSARPALAEQLDLQPHPEGGWYRETFRCARTVRPEGYAGERPTATAIYFLLHPGEESAWHVVKSDDRPDGGPATEITLGVGPGREPQVLVPAGVWQAAFPASDEFVLVSCVVSPGFDFADFRLR